MDLDPRLIEQIREAGDLGEVEALVLVADDPSEGAPDDDRGAAGPVVDRAIQQSRDKPSKLRFLPKLGAVLIRGPGRLLRSLLDSGRIISASTNEAEGPGKPLDHPPRAAVARPGARRRGV